MYFTTDPSAKPSLPFYKTALFFVCVLILLVNAGSSLHSLATLKGANFIQQQTARVADKVQYVNVLVTDAESSLRGYYLSGSDAYLGPWRTASSQLAAQFAELEKLLADNPSQLKNLAQLRTLVQRKLAGMDQTLAVYRSGGLDDIVTIAESADDKAVMDEIRLLAVIMVREQSELLTARSATFYEEYQNAVLLGIGINAMAVLVLALFYRLVRRSYFARVMSQRALQVSNDNLESMVVLRTEQLSVLSRHLISVSEEEKARLARELHDEMGANLTAVNFDISTVAARLQASEPELAAMLARARATLVDTVELKRRIVENLRPSLLDNLGLAAALRSYCEEFGRVSGLGCEALIDGEVDVAGPMHAIAIFRIVQEALNNTAKYAQAKHAIVHLAREAEGLSLEVQDDGVGIDSEAVSKPRSHGLLGMRERALLLGGTLKVKRGINGVGTSVTAFIPLGREAPGAGGAAAGGVEKISVPRPSAGGHIPSSPPYSTLPHIPRALDGQ